MNKIIKLESLRGFAGLYVTLAHLILRLRFVPDYVKLLFRFGQEAVILFFVLSGFVIYLNYEKGKEKPLSLYFIKRFRRIYFPFICAILISIILVRPSFSLKELIGNLLMLQDFRRGKPGNLINPFLGNIPLWSLSYEWTFYLIFPFILPAIQKSKLRVHFIGVFSTINLIIYILFPNHLPLVLAYFLIWWTGLEMCDWFLGNSDKSNQKALIFYHLIMVLILIIDCIIFYKIRKNINTGYYPYVVLRHFGFSLLCLFLYLYLYRLTNYIVGFLRPFSIIAPISYGIYVLNYPILIQANFNLPYYLEILVKFILLFGLAFLIEVVLQPQVNKVIKLYR